MGMVRMGKVVIQRFYAGLRRQDDTPIGTSGPRPVLQHKPYRDKEVAFELTEEIPEEHNPEDEYSAKVRDWDASQHAGKGAYVTGATDIVVRDIREVGYYGASGHKGACKIRYTSTGTQFGEICDMECP